MSNGAIQFYTGHSHDVDSELWCLVFFPAERLRGHCNNTRSNQSSSMLRQYTNVVTLNTQCTALYYSISSLATFCFSCSLSVRLHPSAFISFLLCFRYRQIISELPPSFCRCNQVAPQRCCCCCCVSCCYVDRLWLWASRINCVWPGISIIMESIDSHSVICARFSSRILS